jgi:anti-sigma B factor antagonist
VSLDESVANVEHDVFELQLAPLNITVSWRGDTAIMALSGEVDLATEPLLYACLTDIAGDGRGDLIVDLDLVTFLDASGLSFLVTAHTLVAAQDARMTVMSPTRPVRRLFEVTGLNSYLTVVRDRSLDHMRGYSRDGRNIRDRWDHRPYRRARTVVRRCRHSQIRPKSWLRQEPIRKGNGREQEGDVDPSCAIEYRSRCGRSVGARPANPGVRIVTEPDSVQTFDPSEIQ